MNFLKNIAEKAKSVADSPTRSLGMGDDSGQAGGAGPGQEGFICPLCIASFQTPESLQSHYESSHTGGEVDIARHSPLTEKRLKMLPCSLKKGIVLN